MMIGRGEKCDRSRLAITPLGWRIVIDHVERLAAGRIFLDRQYDRLGTIFHVGQR